MADDKVCPKCGGKNILVCLHIFASDEARDEAIRAKIVLDPPWKCADCQHKWGEENNDEKFSGKISENP